MTNRKKDIGGGEIKKIVDKLIKQLDKPHKLGFIPLNQTKDEKLKVKLLKKLLEYNWWIIEDRFKKEIYYPTIKCYMYGSHRWIGCREKNRHVCRICGWKTHVIIDPIYIGGVRNSFIKEYGG